MKDAFPNTDDYNQGKKHKISIVFNVMFEDTISNKKTSTNSYCIIYSLLKIKHFFCCHQTITVCCSKKS